MSDDISNPCNKLESLDISQDSDVFIGLRKNWCCMLEEILECPICLDIPMKNIYQCIKGHDICAGCRLKLSMCPICDEPFNGARNWCLEKVISNLEGIKSCLLDPTSNTEKCNRVKKVSRGTQTVNENIPMKKNEINLPLRRSTRRQKRGNLVRSKSK